MRYWTGLALLLAAAPTFAADEKAAKSEIALLVPAYFYPEGRGRELWDALLKASADVPVIAIVNPASGPGRRVDANYIELLKRAAKTKATLIGYVSTAYAKRPADKVKAEVDAWLRFYPGIAGIFFDEQASGAAEVDYYAKLYDYVRKEKRLSLVMTNPGTTCDETYVKRPAADAVCLFENGKGFDKFQMPDWTKPYAPERFAVLSYGVGTADEMRKQVRALADKKVGRVYVTSRGGGNPWDGLPKYWDDEVAQVRELNQQKPR